MQQARINRSFTRGAPAKEPRDERSVVVHAVAKQVPDTNITTRTPWCGGQGTTSDTEEEMRIMRPPGAAVHGNASNAVAAHMPAHAVAVKELRLPHRHAKNTENS